MKPPTQNKAEHRFRESALKAGYEVLTGGWPDFLLVKGSEVLLVEVKDSNKLQPNQLRMLTVLQSLGLDVKVSINGNFHSLASLDGYNKVKFKRTLGWESSQDKWMDSQSTRKLQ